MAKMALVVIPKYLIMLPNEVIVGRRPFSVKMIIAITLNSCQSFP
jgi:hypothetical protein